MIATIFGIVGAVIVIAFMIIAHECGHFFMGKRLGFTIDQFALGFGPKLFSWKKNETDFSIRAFPVGGYCLFRGEDENSNDPKAFNSQKPWKRFLVIIAGAVANLITALIIAIIFLAVYGDSKPVVYDVAENSPAYEYGVMAGDVINEYEGEKIDFSIEMSFMLMEKEDDAVLNMVVERDGNIISLDVPKEYNAEQDKYLAGFTFEQQPVRFTILESIGLSFKWLFLIIKQMLSYLGGLFVGTSSTNDVGGIVSVVQIVSQAFSISFGTVLYLVALLSINLAVINLLPLPAVDGGRLVFIIIEMIFRKPISREIEGTIHAIGMFLLFALMIVLTYKDLTRIFFGG